MPPSPSPSPSHTPPRLSTLVALTALSTLSLNLFLPSLANIAGEFAVDYALVNLSIAGYLAVTAILQLLAGPLSDRLGRRPVVLAALALFALASLGCALARDIGEFLAFRLLQAAVICGYLLSLASIRDSLPPQHAASRIGYVGMAMALAPMLGPLLGGVLDDLFGWRANFWLYTALAVALLALCRADFGETHHARSDDFSAQLRQYPALLRSRRYWGYALCMAFSTATFYAFLAGAPLAIGAVLSPSPTTLGIALGSMTAGFVLGNFLSGRYASRFALSSMMIGGRLIASLALSAALLVFLLDGGGAAWLFGAVICAGLGNGLSLPSGNAGAMSVRPELAASAAGLAGALIVTCGAIVSSLSGGIVAAGGSAANSAGGLLATMLCCSLLALLAALDVRRTEARTMPR